MCYKRIRDATIGYFQILCETKINQGALKYDWSTEWVETLSNPSHVTPFTYIEVSTFPLDWQVSAAPVQFSFVLIAIARGEQYKSAGGGWHLSLWDQQCPKVTSEWALLFLIIDKNPLVAIFKQGKTKHGYKVCL